MLGAAVVTIMAGMVTVGAAISAEPIRRDRRGASTIVAMSFERLRAVRDHLSDFVDGAEREHERVVVTRNDQLVGHGDLAALEETLDVLADPQAGAELADAREEVAGGDVVRGMDAVRALRPQT